MTLPDALAEIERLQETNAALNRVRAEDAWHATGRENEAKESIARLTAQVAQLQAQVAAQNKETVRAWQCQAADRKSALANYAKFQEADAQVTALRAERDQLREDNIQYADEWKDCEPFLKDDGEQPAECIERHRKDINALMTLLGQETAQVETLQGVLKEAGETSHECLRCGFGTNSEDERCPNCDCQLSPQTWKQRALSAAAKIPELRQQVEMLQGERDEIRHAHVGALAHQRTLRADKLRAEAQVETLQGELRAEPPRDLMDDLHAVFTEHGILSRQRTELVGDVISWAARGCRQSQDKRLAAAETQVTALRALLRACDWALESVSFWGLVTGDADSRRYRRLQDQIRAALAAKETL